MGVIYQEPSQKNVIIQRLSFSGAGATYENNMTNVNVNFYTGLDKEPYKLVRQCYALFLYSVPMLSGDELVYLFYYLIIL